MPEAEAYAWKRYSILVISATLLCFLAAYGRHEDDKPKWAGGATLSEDKVLSGASKRASIISSERSTSSSSINDERITKAKLQVQHATLLHDMDLIAKSIQRQTAATEASVSSLYIPDAWNPDAQREW
jgi:hypothetical protein